MSRYDADIAVSVVSCMSCSIALPYCSLPVFSGVRVGIFKLFIQY